MAELLKSYTSDLKKLDPNTVLYYLPGWEYHEKVFRQILRFKERAKKQRGWVFVAPRNRLNIELNRNAGEAVIYNRFNTAYVFNVHALVLEERPSNTVVSLLGNTARLYLAYSLNPDSLNQVTCDYSDNGRFRPLSRFEF